MKYISDSYYQRRSKLEEWVSDPKNKKYYILEEKERKLIINDRDQYKSIGVFYVPKKARWEQLRNHAMHHDIGKYIDEAMEAIENENPKQLKGVLPKAFSDVTLEFDDKNAMFSFENFRLICRLVEGVYPNYATVIPKDNPNKLVVDRIELFNTLKRVSIFANQASNLVGLSISGNQLRVNAQDIDYAISAHEIINCQYDGDEMEIGFKSNFLIEILSNISATEVVVELSDPTRAGIVVPKDSENENEEILMLLMPMMINN